MEADFGVVYMVSGRSYAVRLVVSVHSLRQHWGGPVTILVGNDDALPFAEAIVNDERLGPTDIIQFQGKTGTKGRHHANKSRLIALSPYGSTVFLDADTQVVGSFVAMFPRIDLDEIRLTQWNDWTTNNEPYNHRLAAYAHLLKEVPMLRSHAYPAINTGVMGFTQHCRESNGRTPSLSELWQNACNEKPDFMCDEMVMQCLLFRFRHIVLDHTYNASPLYSKNVPGFDPTEVKVWHYHGAKHLNRSDAQEIWAPAFRHCVAENIAGMADWDIVGDKLDHRRTQEWLKGSLTMVS